MIMRDDWNSYSRYYLTDIESSYHRERFRMVEALLQSADFEDLLDFGCGDGRFLELATRGWGFDISSEMIEAASLRVCARASINLRVGSIDELSEVPSESVSAVLAANVLAYLSHDQLDAFYEQAHRILRPSGALVVTHSNELFDLFTLNKFTVAFFTEHFDVDVSSLLNFPASPDRPMHNVRANPLSYGSEMQSRGFREVQQEFAIHHPLPPLLDPGHEPDALGQREVTSVLEYPPRSRWKAMFTCSIFGSRLVKSPREYPVSRRSPANGA